MKSAANFSGWAIEVDGQQALGPRLADDCELTHVTISHRVHLPLVSTALFRTRAHAQLAIRLEIAASGGRDTARPVKVHVIVESV